MQQSGWARRSHPAIVTIFFVFVSLLKKYQFGKSVFLPASTTLTRKSLASLALEAEHFCLVPHRVEIVGIVELDLFGEFLKEKGVGVLVISCQHEYLGYTP